MNQFDVEKDNVTEPQITSTDPVERKIARRLRILRRLNAVRRSQLPAGEILSEEIVQTLVEKQIDESWEKLQKKYFVGDEYITNIRVAADNRELQRRKELSAEQKRIAGKLQSEGQIAEEMFHKIVEGWPELVNSNDPLHIDNGLAQQKFKCEELLKRKNDLLDALDIELNYKDTRYAQDEYAMRQDLRTLADRIDRQCILMRKSFKTELHLIEEAIANEKWKILAENKHRSDHLYQMRNEKEGENIKLRMEQLDQHEEEMYRLQQKHQEKFRELKINLGNDIEQLQQELQNLKALCLLNCETMDYSYQILKRREDENIVVKSNQTRKINKLQDTVNKMRKKIESFTTESNIEIQKLTEEVLKLNSNIIDIERKAEHFSYVNDRRYREIWNMNTKEAQDLLKRINNIDKIIYEQQLGLSWDSTELGKVSKTSNIKTQNNQDNVDATEIESIGVDKLDHVGKATLLNRLLRLLADKSGYLIEDRLMVLLAPYSENDRTIINLDNVFAALQIKRQEDIDMLLEYFLPYCYCEICLKEQINEQFDEEIGLTTKENFSSTDTLLERPKGAQIFLIEEDIQSGFSSASSSHKSDEILQADKSRLSSIDYPAEILNEILANFTYSTKEPPPPPLSNQFESYTTISLTGDMDTSGLESQISVQSKVSMAAPVGTKKLSESMFQPMIDQGSTAPKWRCSRNHIMSIQPAYIVRAIKEFSTSLNVNKEKEVLTLNARLARRKNKARRLLSEDEIKKYWENFRTSFPKKKEHVWDALLIGLKKYHNILKDRKELFAEVMALRKQNTELRQLMRNLLNYSDFQFLPPLSENTKGSSIQSTETTRSSVTSSLKSYQIDNFRIFKSK